MRRSRRIPWLIVTVIAVLAIGAAIATFLTMRPGDGGGVAEQGGGGFPVEPAQPGERDDAGAELGTVVTWKHDIAASAERTATDAWCLVEGDTLRIEMSGEAQHETSGSTLGPDEAPIVGGFYENNLRFAVDDDPTYTCTLAGQLFLTVEGIPEGYGGVFHAVITRTSAEQ